MSDTIRDGLIVTVVGGLLVSLILWLLGLLKPVWGFLRSTMIKAWRLVSRSRRKRARPVASPQPPPAVPLMSEADPPRLDELESRVMRAFAAADGAHLNIVEISYRVPVAKLRIEAALESLTKNGLVKEHHNYLDGTSYGLTSRGRDFLIRKGAV